MQLREKLNEVFQERENIEAEKNKVENLLNNNLICKRNQLTQDLQEIVLEDKQRQLEAANHRLSIIQNEISKNETALEAQKEKVASAIQEVNFYSLKLYYILSNSNITLQSNTCYFV